MQFKRAEFTSMFAKLALSLILAFAVLAGTLDQKAYAGNDLAAVGQSNAHEILCTCDNCNQEEPDDTDIEEVLEFIDDTDGSDDAFSAASESPPGLKKGVFAPSKR